MGYHQKAASCSAIPSFNSLTSISTASTTTTTTPPNSIKHKSARPSSFSSSSAASKQTVTDQLSLLFPLPSFCLYSKKALVNEYALESEIVQFLAPLSIVLKERLPMFVGVLQSLFTVVNDMPFVDREEEVEEEEEEVEDEDEYTDMEEEEQNELDSSSPFTIIGLNSMKLVIWNNMYDHVTDSTVFKKDLCLVIFVSAHLTDAIILKNMNSLKESILNENSCSSFNVSYSLIDFLPKT